MLQETLKTEKGRFLLSHIYNCKECYNLWALEAPHTPQGKVVRRLDEILSLNHTGNIV